MSRVKYFSFLVFALLALSQYGQVPPNINFGNPNFPFPQFKDYKGGNGKLETIASSAHHAPGVTHAEMELRIREAYRMICNNLTYNISGAGGPVTVSGVKYIQPDYSLAIQHCRCVEGDAYNLLAAAYMADKPTFDGYFMWMHDRQFQKTQRYIDCIVNSPGYAYSPGISGAGSSGSGTSVYGGALTGNSATDGDVDLAMALFIAWKQWGDTASIATNPCTGTKITYKEEALKYMTTMVDTVAYTYFNGTAYLPNGNYTSGVIGLDGYLKNGDSWNEITNWAPTYKGIKREVGGGQFLYIDYSAPAYFNAFAKILQTEGADPWVIDQYKRGEASCDWLMGQMASQNLIAFAGRMTLNAANVPTFRNFNDGEDFRLGWRTILNYVWNGNATTSWDPATHEVVAGGNTYELNLAKNNQKFMNSPQAYGNSPYKLPTLNLDICGISTMTTFHGPQGGGPDSLASATYFRLNKAFGPFSTSAVATQDFNLMAKIFRKCEITWDAADGGAQKYLTSNPLYFHEFFRFLGMMVVSGNYHNPLDMEPAANMKIYKKVNKTYAYTGDTLTYTISYRNYGKPDADGVVITDTLPAGLKYISHISSNAGVLFNPVGNVLVWNIGTVKGTNVGLPSNLEQTKDSIIFKVKVDETAFGRLCNSASVTTLNGTGWRSNEYPNHVTETMERNCVDILIQKPITIRKTVDKAVASAGDVLTYTIVIKNKPVDFLNGGRPGVYFTLGLQPYTNPASELKMNFRFFHGADEAYINYKNYRVSYYLQEPTIPNWQVAVSNAEGFGAGAP
ncbi:MAG TPA: hypothetical protein VL947_08200, partial [Cytophagales bacterium]|nr:hypothetical protein [Cytophagales bacterium]